MSREICQLEKEQIISQKKEQQQQKQQNQVS